MDEKPHEAPESSSRRWIPRGDDRTDLLLFLLILSFYLRTMARDLAWGDSAEFALIAATGGVTHPTGYPLYTLILFFVATWLPFPVPVSIALVSAVAAAAAFPVLRRVMGALGVSPWIARAFCLLLAFSREIWIQASTPEVYALHLLFCANLMREMVRHEVDIRRMSIGLGFALTHHLQSIFLIPGLVWRAWRAGAKPVPRTPVLLGAPLLLYLLLPWEASSGRPFAWGQPDSIGALVAHATGRQFSYRMFRTGEDGMGAEVGKRAGDLLTQFDPAGILGVAMLALAVLGLRELGAKDPRTVPLVGSAALTFFFAASYSIPDKEPYFITVHVIVAVLAAVGVDAWDRSRRKRKKKDGERPASSVPALCLLISLVPLAANFHRADHSRDSSLRDHLEDTVEATAPSGSLVLMENVQAWAGALYLVKVEGKFPQAAFFSSYLAPLPWSLPQFARVFPQVKIPEGLEGQLKKHREVLALDGVRRGPGVEDGLVYLEKELLGRPLTAEERASYGSGLEKDPKGFLNQMLADWVQRRLVEANLDGLSCYLALHRFDTPAPAWNGLHVEDRGMVLQVRREAPSSSLVPLSFPPATEYAVELTALPDRRRLARRYASILNRFGILNIQRGDYGAAEVCFIGALSRDPQYAVVHTNLGVLYEKHLNRPDRALEHYERSVDLDPDGPQAKAIREWLAKQKPGA